MWAKKWFPPRGNSVVADPRTPNSIGDLLGLLWSAVLSTRGLSVSVSGSPPLGICRRGDPDAGERRVAGVGADGGRAASSEYI